MKIADESRNFPSLVNELLVNLFRLITALRCSLAWKSSKKSKRATSEPTWSHLSCTSYFASWTCSIDVKTHNSHSHEFSSFFASPKSSRLKLLEPDEFFCVGEARQKLLRGSTWRHRTVLTLNFNGTFSKRNRYSRREIDCKSCNCNLMHRTALTEHSKEVFSFTVTDAHLWSRCNALFSQQLEMR